MVSTLLFITLIEIQIILSYSSYVKNTVFINKSSLALPALNKYLFFFFIRSGETSAYFSLINVFPYRFISPVYKMGFSFFFLRSLMELLVYLKILQSKTLSQLKLKLYKKKKSSLLFFVYFQEKVLHNSIFELL